MDVSLITRLGSSPAVLISFPLHVWRLATLNSNNSKHHPSLGCFCSFVVGESPAGFPET
jgi:hypothetical protein